MRIEIRDPEKQLTEAEIKAFEQKHNVVFPEAYKHFLLRNNGGRPKPNRFYIGNPEDPESDISTVDWLLAIHDGFDDNLEIYLEDFNERLPQGVIPIAHDPGGNLICLGVAGDRLGKIFFWDHEFELESEADENLSLIANSLEEFFSNLFEK